MTSKGPKLVFLDCGIVTEVRSSEHENLINICLALFHFDGHKAGQLMIERDQFAQMNNSNTKNEPNGGPNALDGFCDGIQELVEKAKRENCFEHVTDYVNTICDLSLKYKVHLMSDLLNIAMGIKVSEGMSLALNPEFELAQIAIPVSFD